MSDFTGRVALITGAASGIGKEVAARFIKAGGTAVIADLNFDAARAAAQELGEARSFAVAMDVADEASVNDAVENIGARRLSTVMEKLLEDISFTAEDRKGDTLTIDKAFVEKQLSDVARNADLSRYVL